MPFLLFLFLKTSLSVDELNQVVEALRKCRCPYKNKCSLDCKLCYKSLLLSDSLYWELFRFFDGNNALVFRSPIDLVFPQFYTLIRVLISILGDDIQRIVVPTSFSRFVEIMMKNGYVYAQHINSLTVGLKVNEKDFAPPHVIVIRMSKNHLDDETSKHLLKEISDRSKTLKIIRINDKTIKFIAHSDLSLLRYRFIRIGGKGFIVGNPRIYSKGVEFLDALYMKYKEQCLERIDVP